MRTLKRATMKSTKSNVSSRKVKLPWPPKYLGLESLDAENSKLSRSFRSINTSLKKSLGPSAIRSISLYNSRLRSIAKMKADREGLPRSPLMIRLPSSKKRWKMSGTNSYSLTTLLLRIRCLIRTFLDWLRQ